LIAILMASFGFGDWLLSLLKTGLQMINSVVSVKRRRVQTNKRKAELVA